MITKEEAKARHLQGWNLRCNVCGSYGMQWYHETHIRRPSWGSIALCPECYRKAQDALSAFLSSIEVKYEQKLEDHEPYHGPQVWD